VEKNRGAKKPGENGKMGPGFRWGRNRGGGDRKDLHCRGGGKKSGRSRGGGKGGQSRETTKCPRTENETLD